MEYRLRLSPNNFSGIARRLLLNRQRRKKQITPAVDLPENETEQHEVICLPQTASDCKAATEEDVAFLSEHLTFEDEILSDEVGPSKRRPCRSQKNDQEKRISFHLCHNVQSLPVERLMRINSDEANRPALSAKTKVMIRRVRQFFEEFKKILGDNCEGTVFNSTVELTAWACGVTPDTVTRLGVREKFVHEPLPRTKKKKDPLRKEKLKERLLKKYSERWGEIIRYFIENKLQKDNMTTTVLHAELRRAYVDFQMSKTTFYSLLVALGVKYKSDRGRHNMFYET